MSAASHLGTYAEGWTKGDADTILSAASKGFTFDDPNAGKIPASGFAEYLAGMKEEVKGMRGGSLPEPFMELSEVVTSEADGVLTAWCWWSVAGTGIQGSGLIKVSSDGVRSEVITYYAKPAG